MRKKAAHTRKKRSVGRIVSNVLIVVGVALIIAAAAIWGRNQWRYHEQDVETEKLATYVKLGDDSHAAPVVDWAGLKAINPEVVGWLEIPGTVVNYPVYQHSDNEYYLTHNADGSTSIGGQVFMDSEGTAPGMVDPVTIIYGHHLRNGAMFKQVADMDKQDLFDQVDTVWYETETATYELEPLFLYYTTPEDTTVRIFEFGADEDYRAYLQGKLASAVTRRSDAEQIIQQCQHVLTLSTCNYYDGYGRTELVCVPKAEAVVASGASS